ncbi:MAG: aminotransferase class I/II-fold pyridoxal phosphate-dependent enzyme [Chitinophagales bacterium]|nr:aminotransferase class I/II-fold pyridoxal phosphate-dependent enzyme [Chitinophagales bacterium]
MIIEAAHKLSFVNEYYFSRKLKEIRELILQGKPVLNLGIGNPDMTPSSETIEALVAAAQRHDSHGYQSYIGIPALRQAMSQWYIETYDALLDPETEVLPLLGSKEGITHISQAFINPGDKVLIPNPGYPTYESATRLAGGIPIYYNLSETNLWEPDFAQISEQDLKDAKLLWINYPNMPTGSKGDMAMFEKVIEIANKYSILVVNDNPYSLVLNEGKPVSIFQVEGSKEVCLELNSLSKSHNMAGWRIGMLCGAKDYISTVLKVKSNVDSGMFLPMQEAAVSALRNTSTWHQERNKVYEQRRELAYAIMDALQCRYDKHQVGMFLWAKIPDSYKDSGELADIILYDADVFITPGFIFGSNGARYLRISLCSPESMLQEALQRIKRLEL